MLLCIFAARIFFGIYNNIWQYADSEVFLSVIAVDVVGGAAAVILSVASGLCIGILENIALIFAFMLCTLSTRFLYQKYLTSRTLKKKKSDTEIVDVAVVGTGQLAVSLVNELKYGSRSRYKPVCFVYNHGPHIGGMLCGLPVLAEDENIVDTLKSMKIKEIFIALAYLPSENVKRLHTLYSQTGCKVRLYEFPMKDLTEKTAADRGTLRDIRIEDLLFRDECEFTDEKTDMFYRGRTILVTGGGGSIGSELCRQIAARSPEKLIILDIYENNAYEIQQELIRKYGASLDLSVEIASVRDRTRLEAIFHKYRPEIVFHAAAHKHVPLMEHSSCEAVKNNVLGTFNTADMAEKYGASKFIMISTDKAVNPTNIMGASKRMGEMIIQSRHDSKTSFAAVRFGNVLGSNGSVIPLFRRQIKDGGPLTVTDKRIIRYFMTIPEASQLLLAAGAMAKSGELFVLDMGKPVKILDLAENMIRLSGLKPYDNIDIVEIGLRPGEKLYEELLIKTEELDKTSNSMIFIERDKPFTRAEVAAKIKLLTDAVDADAGMPESPSLREAMKEAVPTFREPEEVNKTAISSEEMKVAARVERPAV